MNTRTIDQNIWKFFFAVGLLALVLAIATGCSGQPAAAAPTAQNNGDGETRTISVSGNGKASGSPDIAYVSLGIQTQAGDIDAAISEANSVMADVRDAIAGAGVAEDDMQTADFNVNVEQPRDDRGQPTGQPIYHVRNVLRVTVRDIETVGDVIGAGLDAGANTVHNLSFSIEDTSALQAEARSDAVADARQRAEQLAEELEVELGGPVSVSESFGSVPVERVEYAAMDMAAGAGAPPISTGQLSVTVNVQVSFEIVQ